jgi:hypothetical protein
MRPAIAQDVRFPVISVNNPALTGKGVDLCGVPFSTFRVSGFSAATLAFSRVGLNRKFRRCSMGTGGPVKVRRR